MRTRGQARGYSLIEIMVAITLLLVGLAVLNFAFSSLRTSRAHVQGEVEQLAETLRSLRQQAITQGRPTGIGIPTEYGTRPAANGFYILEGEIRPKVVRRVLLGDGRAIQISGCSWPELNFENLASHNLVDSNYSLADWSPPFPQDGLLMFLPSGEMLTNLPTYQGQAALVLAYGLQMRNGGLGFEVERAQGAVTLWSSVLGEVRHEGGIPGAPARSGAITMAAAPAAPPERTLESNRPPSFVAPFIEVSPPPNPSTLPFVAPGNGSTLRIHRYISLKVTATDPDGDPLWCRWTERNNAGTFTKNGEVKMRFDPSLRLWVATWAWHAPQGVNANDQFSLDAEVSDDRGGSARLSAAVANSGRVHILTPGRLAFTRGNHAWISNWDGSDPVIVARDCTRPRWSRGGHRLVVKENGASGNLRVVTPDGRSNEALTARGPVDWRSSGSWSKNDSRVAFVERLGTGATVHTVRSWGTDSDPQAWAGGLALPVSPTGQPVIDFHPDDDELALVSDSETGELYLVTPDSHTVLAGVTGAEASFSRNGEKIIYRDAANQIVIAPYASGAVGGAISQANHAGARGPRFSHDEGYVVIEAPEGARQNCFLLRGNLSQPLPLFNFSENCQHPDWGQ